MRKPDEYVACVLDGVVHIRTAGAGPRTFCQIKSKYGLVDLKRKVTPTLLSYCCRACSVAYMKVVEPTLVKKERPE